MKHSLYLQPKRRRIQKNKNFRTIKIKITVKATNHKDIHKNLFELADRRMEIKKMC